MAPYANPKSPQLATSLLAITATPWTRLLTRCLPLLDDANTSSISSKTQRPLAAFQR